MGNLPFAVNSFVGRDRDLMKVSNLMGGSRIVTITGPPGVGKTRLALEAAARLDDIYADGVWVVELVGVRDASALAHAVAGALGVHESAAGKDVETSLTGYLRARHVLLVVDNAEHLVGACAALVVRLAGGCADVSFLVTSRQPLNVAGERVLVTEPLGLPEDDFAEDAALAPAVRLFVERAREVQQGFALTPGTLVAVAEICRQVDGLPLAIELAAARVGSVSVRDIAAQLDHRLDLLARETNGDPRHRSLRMALAWSHDLLCEQEQLVLRRLSAFAGSFTAQAAGAVAGLDEWSVVDVLVALVAKSLVVADTAPSTARYKLLETVRTFAGEHLDRTGESGAVGGRHTDWCVGVAGTAEERLTGPHQVEALDELDAAYPDMLSALDRTVGAGQHEDALRLAGGLSLYWRLRGRYSEGRRWLEVAVGNAAGSAGFPPEVLAAAHWGAGFQALMLGDNERAVGALQAALTLARDTGDRHREARTLLLLGNTSSISDSDTALERLTASHEAAVGTGDSWCAAHAMALIARLKLDGGDLAGASQALEPEVTRARATSDLQSLRISASILGDIRLALGRLKEAEALFAETLDVAGALGDPNFVAVALRGLARVSLHQGHPEIAERFLDRAVAALPEQTHRERVDALGLRAEVARFRGDHVGTIACLREVAGLLQESGEPSVSVLAALAYELIKGGETGSARAVLDEAEEALAGLSGLAPPAHRSQQLRALGELDVLDGRLDKAGMRYQEALRLEHQTGDDWGVTVMLGCLGHIALRDRRYAYAVRLLAASETIRQTAGYANPPVEVAAVRSSRATLTKAIGGEKFASLWDEGSGMSVDEVVAYALRRRGVRAPEEAGWPRLTKTEKKVAALVADGHSNAEIAAKLFVSRRTVETHLANMFPKLGVTSRTQLALSRTPDAEKMPQI